MALSDAADNFRDMRSASEELNMSLQDAMNLMNDIDGIQERINQHKKDGNKLTVSEVAELKKSVQSHSENLSKAQKTLAVKGDELRSKQKSEGLSKKELQQLEKIESEQQKISDELNFQEGKISEINKDLKNTTGVTGSLSKKFAQAGKFLDKVQLPFDFPKPMELFNKLSQESWEALKELDKALGDTAKSMNITYSEAEKQRIAINGSVDATDKLTVRTQDVVENVKKLNESTGLSVQFQDMSVSLQEDIKLMASLGRSTGLTKDQQNAILKYTQGTRQEATKVTKEIMASYKIQGLKSGLVLNEKDAMKEIANTSARMQLSIKGGAAGLGEALASSKALGVSLSQVEKTADSLLNFEQSLEKELSAELLLGRDINLEKARQAALDNDMAVVAQEIQKQVGSAAEFGNLSRIQQESIAEAMGMQANELGDALIKQEELASISENAALSEKEKYDKMVEMGMTEKEIQQELGDEAMKNIEDQLSMEEKATLEKEMLQEEVQKAMLGNMSKMNNLLSDQFDWINKIIKGFGIVQTVVQAISLIQSSKMLKSIGEYAKMITGPVMSAVKSLRIKEFGAAAIGIVKNIWSSIGWTPVVGPALAAAAIGTALGALGTYLAMDDGIIPPGYGDRILTTKKGSIAFNNEDTIVAGTNLGIGNDVTSKPSGETKKMDKGTITAGGTDMSQTNALLQQLINAVTAGSEITLDGNKVGQALNIGARKMQ